MRSYIISIFFLTSNFLFAQEINDLSGTWIQEINDNSSDEVIYKYYMKGEVIWIWYYEKAMKIDDEIIPFGFYHTCDLPSISSLKDKGKYYFEVNSTDFDGNDDEIKVSMQNSCAELHIFNKGKETMMNIYYSSRQQYATYKRIKKLPDKIVKYLNSKGIKIPKETIR